MRLRSFKLNLRERRARIVPATDGAGCPFSGPGVDLTGAPAEEAFVAAAPMLEALASIEPGIVVRSLSVDLERRRLLATLDPTVPEADSRGRVVRIEEGGALRLVLQGATPLLELLAKAAGEALARRSSAV